MTRQYFTKSRACKAASANDPDCICWFDEGAGPFPEVREADDCAYPRDWRDKPAPPWTANIMPDDDLDPDSLVGRMIHGWEPRPQSPEEVAAGLRQAFRKCIEDGVVSPLLVSEPHPTTPEPLPLWRVMERAGMSEPGTPRDAIAAEIDALRDYLPMVPPEEFVEQWANEPSASMASMTARTMEWVCALLTEQARIARGES